MKETIFVQLCSQKAGNEDVISTAESSLKMSDLESEYDSEPDNELQDTRSLKYFLRIQINRNRQKLIVIIAESAYIEPVCERFNMMDVESMATPMNRETKFYKLQNNDKFIDST